MRCLGLLLLGLGLNGCVVTRTSPLFLETRDDTVRILRYGDPDGGWEGLLTLWATPDDGSIRESIVTIHESRKAQ